MPRRDRTGPMGMGPMTGRGFGPCGEIGLPRSAHPFPGWGSRRRGGPGRGGLRRSYVPPMPDRFAPAWAAPSVSREQEQDWLKAQAADMEEALKQIRERLNELEQD